MRGLPFKVYQEYLFLMYLCGGLFLEFFLQLIGVIFMSFILGISLNPRKENNSTITIGLNVSRVGIEPTTKRLKVSCSTAELPAQLITSYILSYFQARCN